MNALDQIRCDLIFGRIELVPTFECRGSKLVMGGYSIRYDENGREVSRSKNEPMCSLDCGSEWEANLQKSHCEIVFRRAPTVSEPHDD